MSTRTRPPTPQSRGELRPKVARFVAEYLKDLNAKQAAIRAGYSAKTAEVQGCRLLRNPEVAKAVAEGQATQLAEADLSAERTLQEVARIAFFDPAVMFDDAGHLKPLPELPPDARAAVAYMKGVSRSLPGGKGTQERIQIKFWDKVRALEILARHFNLLTKKVELGTDEELLALLDAGRQRNAARKREAEPTE